MKKDIRQSYDLNVMKDLTVGLNVMQIVQLLTGQYRRLEIGNTRRMIKKKDDKEIKILAVGMVDEHIGRIIQLVTDSDGAQDSTSTRCALGTSSRELRILIESGDIYQVYFPSVGRLECIHTY